VVDRLIAEIVFAGKNCADGEAILATDKVLVEAALEQQYAKGSVEFVGKRPVSQLRWFSIALPCSL